MPAVGLDSKRDPLISSLGTPNKVERAPHRSWSQLWQYFYLALVLSIRIHYEDPEKHRIIMDGGSTGARRVILGLSANASDPKSARLSIIGLLEFGKGTVPKELWAETEIRLMATAGLRLLDIGRAG
ncbi:hypothetical protein SLEP1_g32225 [Rubroshorea leprosula]|uniref:apyrase n=1 Tax=Rubroshorea leprosula TaxID=152421 RepID=A0AAV5KCP0_9ROSI|nr:hypothetical protein SLEP1_g32225 [Rubroshorea leprosula]